MFFEILDNISWADSAFRVSAETIDDLFYNTALLFLHVMLENPSIIRDSLEFEIRLDNPRLDMLLYQFVEELIFIKDTRRALLFPKSSSVLKQNDIYSLVICLTGEEIDRSRHSLKTDVKGITMHALSITMTPEGAWEATFVLDV